MSNDGQQVTGTETEPNGSDISADPIVFDTPVTGIIMTSTDDDWFVISNDTARTITVSLAGSESVYGYWKAGVYDSGNTLLAQMSDMGSNDSFNVSLPAAGNYSIVISDDSSAAYQYQYQVTVLSNDGQQVTGTETEPNGSDISADPIVFDTPVTGIIMTSTDDDWFVISNDTARTITVSLAGSESVYGYWKAGVYDSGNTLLAQMSDMGSNDSFNVSLPAAGNYYIVISDDSSAAYQYQYQVTVLSNDGQQVTGTETEPNGSDISADPIVFYTPVTGIIMTSTDDDWFVISNDTARTITVSLAGSESIYGYWKAGVYDSGNTLLAQMSDMGSNDSFNVSLPAAGNYSIVISDDSSAAYQYQYQVTVLSL